MGTCFTKTELEPEAIQLIEIAVQSAVTSAVTQLLADLHFQASPTVQQLPTRLAIPTLA